jgi:hypothetical protein
MQRAEEMGGVMNFTVHERTFPNHLRGVSDGSVAGTHFYNGDTGKESVPAEVTVQQEGLSVVRIRFAQHFGIGSLVMGPGDTLTVNGD